jgi:hypothetical protein
MMAGKPGMFSLSRVSTPSPRGHFWVWGLLVLIFGIVIECFGAIDSIEGHAHGSLVFRIRFVVLLFAPPPPLRARLSESFPPPPQSSKLFNRVFTAG